MNLNEMKGAYISYSCTNNFKLKVKRTEERIQEILKKHNNAYVSYSTGKDSLCMLHLFLSYRNDIPVMFHDSGVELPESYKILEKIKHDFNLNVNVVGTGTDVLDIYKKKNVFFIGGDKDFAWNEVMMNPIRAYAKRNNLDLAAIGLRKEESKKRKMMIIKNGQYHYCKRNSIYQFYPISEWMGRDVFSYIFCNKLDEYIHPAYFKNKFVKSSEDIRVSWFCDPTMITRGHFTWLKYYYGDIYRKLICEFPEIKSYV